MDTLHDYKFQWRSAKESLQEAVELLDNLIDCSNRQDIEDTRQDIERLRREETRAFNEYITARRNGHEVI
jgi:hypothetical protein